MMTRAPLPWGLATLVLVGWPSTFQDSHLRSQPGVTVAGGTRDPIGYGRGPRASTDDIAVNNYIRLGRLAACRDR